MSAELVALRKLIAHTCDEIHCFDWAVTSGARGIVAGGAYFDARGRVYLFRNGIAS